MEHPYYLRSSLRNTESWMFHDHVVFYKNESTFFPGSITFNGGSGCPKK